MFKKKTEIIVHKCIVRLFEDFNAVEYEFLDTHKGSYLMDRLCQRLEIKEKDYFGLRFVDNTKQRQWLDLGKLIIKQCKDIHHLIFSFRVKFYPADPFHLSLNVRVLLYKQLKRDLNHGRIYCSSNEIVTLGALIVQEQFSDYDENIHTGDYLSNLRLSARQTDAIEKKIIKKHRERTPGQDPIIVINEFLRITRNLETYGTEPHYVKDHQGVQMYIGINFSGISAFISGKRTQHFLWNEIRKLNFEGKMFIAHICYMDTSREVINMDANMPLAPTPTTRSAIHVPHQAAALVAAPRTTIATTPTDPRGGTRTLPSTPISAADPQRIRYPICRRPHRLTHCAIFKGLPPQQQLRIVQAHGHCLNCLTPTHNTQECTSGNLCRSVCDLIIPCCTEPPETISVNILVATTAAQYDDCQ